MFFFPGRCGNNLKNQTDLLKSIQVGTYNNLFIRLGFWRGSTDHLVQSQTPYSLCRPRCRRHSIETRMTNLSKINDELEQGTDLQDGQLNGDEGCIGSLPKS